MPAVIPAAPISSPLESTTHVDSAVSSTPSEHIKPDAAEEFVKESELVDSEADTKEPTEGEEDEERRGPVVAAPYNPETGEFNWECPCLGGLPQSVCGEPFKESFRCFVTSEAEPKGMDCIDAFNAMQQCFRDHPEVYARGASCLMACVPLGRTLTDARVWQNSIFMTRLSERTRRGSLLH